MEGCKLSSEENKHNVPNVQLSGEQPSVAREKRKRGRPRKYEYVIYPAPRRAQPIQDVRPAQGLQDNSNTAQITVKANPNIPEDGSQANKSSGDGHFAATVIQALPAGLGATASRSGGSAKRFKSSASPICAPGQAANQTTSSSHAPGEGCAPRGTTCSSGSDNILGKPFVGRVEQKFGSWYYISMIVENRSPMFAWIQDPDHAIPITPENDLAPHLPMFGRPQVPYPGSAAVSQAVPSMPVDPTIVTVAQPLQMRKPYSRRFTNAAPGPSVGPKNATPVSRRTTTSNASASAAGRRLAQEPVLQAMVLESPAKQENKHVDPQTSSAEVQLKSLQPVSGSSMPPANNDAPSFTEGLLGDKAEGGVSKESGALNESNDSSGQMQQIDMPGIGEPSVQLKQLSAPVLDGAKESSEQIQQLNTAVMDKGREASGLEEKPDIANNEYQIMQEPKEVIKEPEAKISEALTQGGDSKAGEGISGATPEIVSQTSVLKEAPPTKPDVIHFEDIHGKISNPMSNCTDQKEQTDVRTSEPTQSDAKTSELAQTDAKTSEPARTDAISSETAPLTETHGLKLD